ncbi:hypothetical protein OHB14_50560 [Streptomyces sp. NBC_01613]|uniref:hypothetical protein n=1 Tax=Streptomyces sp. NBC_01613 TaxID=2975896 RepID=UPI00386423D0
MDAADRQLVQLVEVWYRLVVLQLPVSDHELVTWPVGADGQRGPPPTDPWVSQQPVEHVLGLGRLTQHFVAQVDDVCLVAFVSLSHDRA